MPEGNKHTHFNAADIERYHRGQMSANERHALEKAALDDPFLADALEGYAHGGNVGADLAELRNRLGERTGTGRVIPVAPPDQRFRWMRVAAAIIFLVGGGILASQFLFNKKNNDIADKGETTTVVADTTGEEGTEVTFGADSATTYPMVIDEEPSSGGQPSVTTTKPATTNRADAMGAKTSVKPEISAPVGIADVRKDDEPKAPVLSKPGELDGYVAKEDVNKQVPAGAEKKAVVTQARSAEKYRNYSTNTFRGRVTDENNRGVPFANVTNTRDNVGTYTDASGNFTLTSPDTVLEVQVRSLGYDINTQQIRNSVADNKVVLEENRDGVTETIISRSNSNAMRRQVDNMKVEEPEPADGWENYDLYLVNNLNIPEDFEARPSVPREVELSFEVNKNGEPVNIRVERSLCKSCDQEAIRLIKDGPKWKRNAKKRTRVTVAF